MFVIMILANCLMKKGKEETVMNIFIMKNNFFVSSRIRFFK